MLSKITSFCIFQLILLLCLQNIFCDERICQRELHCCEWDGIHCVRTCEKLIKCPLPENLVEKIEKPAIDEPILAPNAVENATNATETIGEILPPKGSSTIVGRACMKGHRKDENNICRKVF